MQKDLDYLIEEFLSELKARSLKANSLRAYHSDLSCFLSFCLSHDFSDSRNLINLTKAELVEWLKTFPERLSQRMGTNIRKFLLWLYEGEKAEILPEWQLKWKFHNPESIRPDLPPDPTELSQTELEKIFNSNEIKTREKAALSLILNVGISLEELSELSWKNISLDRLPNITIQARELKRIVPIDQNSKELLLLLKKENSVKNSDECVFLKERDKKAMSADFMSVKIRNIIKKTLRKKLSATDLREKAKKELREKNGVDYTLSIIGKKKSFCLVRVSESMKKNELSDVEIEELKKIHERAFA